MADVVVRRKNLSGLRPVLLDGAEVGVCSVVRMRYGSETQVKFYPDGKVVGTDAWLFNTLTDMRERLPAAWLAERGK